TTVAKLGNDLDWYVAKPSTLSTSAANQAANSNTAAMISDLLAMASTTSKAMAEKTALVLKDNASVPLDPLWVGASGPAIVEAWFPGQEDGN
ncbi:hypothetical protein MYF61_28990, partial [Klebsiella quasipneumoniae]|uniref:hypothetical protein n=1 Tax=Klebsiella quasipneumoniae TaxID=1463165 RepID=UPI002033C8BB